MAKTKKPKRFQYLRDFESGPSKEIPSYKTVHDARMAAIGDLPPLNALRAFEAAARRSSFAKAAVELNVTAAAISQQVQVLEAYLGIKLFRRLSRGLVLTKVGEAVLPELTQTFERLSAAVQRLREGGRRGVVTIRVSPAFAIQWLVPRLPLLLAQHPDLDVRIWTTAPTQAFFWQDCELAIRYQPKPFPDLNAEPLLQEVIFPVCSPQLTRGKKPIQTPEDLAFHTLLHDESMLPVAGYPDWKDWLANVGVSGINTDRGPRFNLSNMAIQAAIDGCGVLLGRSVLVAADIDAGRLIRPLAADYPSHFRYFLLSDSRVDREADIRAVHDWLLAEARRSA
ncbi:MAG: transcriptional regulator GcvA [Alphaproteobacteria bacterium]|nr:transcriptional regulator GcvA [Alphaproteobacteria bacterium]